MNETREMEMKVRYRWPIIVVLLLLSIFYMKGTEALPESLRLKVEADSALYHQKYADALRLYTASASKASETSEHETYLRSMASIGQVYSMLGNHDRALIYFKRILPDADKVADPDFKSRLLVGIITSLCQLGYLQEADRTLLILKKRKWSDANLGNYYYCYLKGQIENVRGDNKESTVWFKKALEITKTSRLPPIYETSVLLHLGQSHDNDNSSDSAIHYYELAIKNANKENTKDWLSQAYSKLESLYTKTGDSDMALQYKEKHDSLSSKSDDPEKLENAQNILYHVEENATNNRIGSLNDTVWRQRIIIIIFIVIITAFIILLSLIRKQKKQQDKSYRMLIEKHSQLSQRDEEINFEKIKYQKLLAKASDNEPPESVNPKTLEIIDRINAILDNPEFIFSTDFSLAVLCQEVGSNRSYVSAAVNDFYRKTFPQLLNERRVSEGCRLLAETTHTISEISHLTGYSSPTRFISAFKNLMGMTPAVYRRLKAQQ